MSPEPGPGKVGKSVGEKLRAARQALHYTQSQLAAPNFSVSYISAIERGQIHPSLRALEILAARLGLSSTQLLPNRAQAEDHSDELAELVERDDENLEFALLEARVLIAQDVPEKAIGLIGKFSTRRLKRHQLLQQRYLLGYAYLKLGRFQECEYTLSEALQLAREQNAHYLSLCILNLLALSYAAISNYQQALLTHQRCLNLLEQGELRDPFFTAQVYMHMGQHYTHLEKFSQALEMFDKALLIAEELTTPKHIRSAYRDICEYHATAKDFDLVALYAYKSLHLSNRENQKRLRRELYRHLGRAIMRKSKQEARAFLDEIIKRKSVLRDRLVLASISTRNAEWDFTYGSADEAARCARRAEELARPFGETIIGAEALVILGRVEYAQGDEESGDRHLSSGLAMLERLGYYAELAEEAARYAQLLEERGREREAFTYFRRAFQSSQKVGK